MACNSPTVGSVLPTVYDDLQVQINATLLRNVFTLSLLEEDMKALTMFLQASECFPLRKKSTIYLGVTGGVGGDAIALKNVPK